MRTVALISGGKDSCYNMMQCVAAGHSIVCLANLQPRMKDEMDSYMYQTVGHHGIELYAEAMGLPLYRQMITGDPIELGKIYTPTENDEVEDLYNLLHKIKKELDVEAVAVGAILSDYQRIRVENVCRRLDLVSLAYLWRRNQKELLQEMIASGVEAIIIKVAALGLDPRVHLGLSLREIQPHLLMMKEKYGLNVCGEGGEYETFTLDCPLFKQKLVLDEKELVMHTDDPVGPVGYLNLKRLHLEPKLNFNLTLPPTVKNSLDYVNDLSDAVFSDLSDIESSETEVDSIEKLKKEEEGSERKEINNEHKIDVPNDNVETDYRKDDEETVEECYTYDRAQDATQWLPVIDHRSICGNRHGWYFIGGIVGEGVDTVEATHDALKKLISLIDSASLHVQDVCSVNLYVRDMGDFAALNEVYVKTFSFPNPPTRVCVQCPLPSYVGLIMDAVAYKPNAQDLDETESGTTKERITMHVQGVSHWAPANIGPYSQAFKVGEVIGTCGQIALVPGTMQLVEGGPRRQCTLGLRHLSRVIRAVNPRANIRSVIQSVCYSSVSGSVSEARRQLERRTAGALAQHALVQALPRGAAVEWHAWAHAHNDTFEYEETGCSVDEYKVSITSRWNYENTVAAFVCHIATGTSASPSRGELSFASAAACERHGAMSRALSRSHLARALLYAVHKLTRECPHNTAVNLRIFYQVWSAPPMSVMMEAVEDVRAALRDAGEGGAGGEGGARVCVTAVPVLALHHALTTLTVSGLRLDE